MRNKVVLLTGITGFLGSHIAEYLSKNYIVVGLIRNSSELWRCEEIKNENIKLVNTDDHGYRQQLEAMAPGFLIHCAWGGVAAGDRDDWSSQVKNVGFTYNFLQLAKDLGIKCFIGLGSQAEYGTFSGSVDETHNCKPLSAYGAAKLATSIIVESFCTQNDLNWYWLRIFPMYGTREGLTWFIPSVIKNALENADMELTGCEQKYGYLYVKEFCRAIEKVLQSGNHPGVYNLAANSSIRLRDVIEMIINKTKTTGSFKFGALPYRKNQVMHMEGNSEKFFNTFDFLPVSDFETNMEELIQYYKLKLKPING